MGEDGKDNVVSVKMFSLISIAAVAAVLGPAHAQKAKREVGAHQHGASKLNVAVEDQTIAMELSAPADDIVGFEARPRTEKQKAAIEQATATLRDPLKLFTLPPAAGCTVASASVELVFGEGPRPEASDHAEFEGRYSLSCTNVAAVLDIEFPYFKLFPKVDEVEVQVISPKGQKSFEIKRARPRLSLRNLTS
jgi:Protein of unknown function (DUF2796)